MQLTQDQEMIQAFPSEAADKSFTESIGFRRFHGCLDQFDTTILDEPFEESPILAIMVTKKLIYTPIFTYAALQ
jgi:hypothetical protein